MTTHPSTITEATVYEPEGWRLHPTGQLRPEEDILREFRTAQLLADNGISVVLRGELPDEKNPDAYLLRAGQVEVWDFKHIASSATNAQRSASSQVASARRQRANPMILIDWDITPIGGMLAVNYGVRAALFHEEPRQTEFIGILRGDGTLQILSAEEVLHGVRFR